MGMSSAFVLFDPTDNSQSDELCVVDVDDLLQYHINSPNSNYWCQMCALPYIDCICSACPPVGFYDHSSWNSTLAIPTSNYTANVRQKSHSNPSCSTPSLSIPSQAWTSIAPASGESSAGVGSGSEVNEVKQAKVKETMTIEEARAVCLPCDFEVLQLNKSPESRETISTKSEITARFSTPPSQNVARSQAESGSPNRGE